MPGGRPTTYTSETAVKICALIADGVSLRTICKNDWAPNLTTIYEWLRVNPEFSKLYTNAKNDQADAMQEDIHAISDQKPDMIVDQNGVAKIDPAFVNWQRLRVDSRKWIASKLKPKKYGDSMQLKGSEEAPIQIQVYMPKEEE